MLEGRGLPVLELETVRRAVDYMDDEKAPTFSAQVHRLCKGTENSGDMGEMRAWVQWAGQFGESGPSNTDIDSREAPHGDLPDPDRNATLHPEGLNRVRTAHHVYGAKGAMCAEPTTIEPGAANQEEGVFHTLSLEFALMDPNLSRYAWKNKIMVRLTKRELHMYAAVLLGFTGHFEVKNHGRAKDKSLVIKDQGQVLFAKALEARVAIAVPIPPEEVYPLAAMALETLKRNSPTLDTQTLVMMVKRSATMHGMK